MEARSSAGDLLVCSSHFSAAFVEIRLGKWEFITVFFREGKETFYFRAYDAFLSHPILTRSIDFLLWRYRHTIITMAVAALVEARAPPRSI